MIPRILETMPKQTSLQNIDSHNDGLSLGDRDTSLCEFKETLHGQRDNQYPTDNWYYFGQDSNVYFRHQI